MRIETSLQALNNYTNDMSAASSKIQSGFASMLNKDSTSGKDTEFTSAFVEEELAAKLAKAQLKVIKTQDELSNTLLNLKK